MEAAADKESETEMLSGIPDQPQIGMLKKRW